MVPAANRVVLEAAAIAARYLRTELLLHVGVSGARPQCATWAPPPAPLSRENGLDQMRCQEIRGGSLTYLAGPAARAVDQSSPEAITRGCTEPYSVGRAGLVPALIAPCDTRVDGVAEGAGHRLVQADTQTTIIKILIPLRTQRPLGQIAALQVRGAEVDRPEQRRADRLPDPSRGALQHGGVLAVPRVRGAQGEQLDRQHDADQVVERVVDAQALARQLGGAVR